MIVPATPRWSSVMISSAGNHDINRSLSRVLLLIVLVFILLHAMQWATKCGPFASGRYKDYCTDVTGARQAKQIVINDATQARSRAAARSPYVDLRDAPEAMEAFLPAGHARAKNRVNVREGPGMLFDVIDSLEPDSVVEVIEESEGWLRVRINQPGDAETFGWVWRDLMAQ